MQGDKQGFFRENGSSERASKEAQRNIERIDAGSEDGSEDGRFQFGEVKSVTTISVGEIVANAADRLGITITEAREMSLEELELLEEAHIRNEAQDGAVKFDSLIAFLLCAMPDNKKAFEEGKRKAESLLRALQRRSEYGLTRRRADGL